MLKATARAAGQPEMGRQKFEGGHPDEGRNDVPAQEVAGLGQGALDGPVNEHRRGPERADNHDQVGLIQPAVIDISHRPNPQEGPQPGPKNFCQADPGRALGGAGHFAEVVADHDAPGP